MQCAKIGPRGKKNDKREGRASADSGANDVRKEDSTGKGGLSFFYDGLVGKKEVG